MKKEQLKKAPAKQYAPKKGPLPKKEVGNKSYYALIGLGLIVLLGIVIYSNSFNCSFHFDDTFHIVNNPAIRNLSDVKTWMHYSPFRWVAIFTFVLNYHFGQLNVWGYHLVNLIIHLINACLVWWLSMMIFSSPALKDYNIAKHKKILALLTALLFVSHPLATQSVTYIIQRMASMAAMFYLFSLALYAYARLTNKAKVSKYLLFAGSILSAILAMCTKENAFTLPFAIILFEFFFIRTKKLKINFRDYRLILALAGFFGIVIVVILKFSYSIFKTIPPDQWHSYTITPFNYLLTQFSVIVKYIQLLILPVNQNVDYGYSISNSFFEILTLLCFLLLVSLLVIAVFLFNRNRIISFGIFWFFLTLSIESSIIPIGDIIFEHRTYLPSFGFFMVLSVIIYILLWKNNKYLAISVFAVIIGINSYLTFARNKVYKDELTLWNDDVAKAPDATRPYTNRGITLWNLKQYDRAIADYTKAIAIHGSNSIAYYNRGIVYATLEQWDKAIADYSSAIALVPSYTDAYSNRGITYAGLGQWDKAMADYAKAISIDPKYAKAYYNRGKAYRSFKEWDKAIADYNNAILYDPGFTDAYFNRGNVFLITQKWDKAIVDYSKIIELDPQYKQAYAYRGVAYENTGHMDKAIDDYNKALRIDPNYTTAIDNLAHANNNMKNGNHQ